MASYLVTGVAGFIGSAVAAKLIADGHEVVAIDNLSTGRHENIPQGVIFYEAHCQDENIYKKLPHRNYSAIFHIAGQSSGEISFDDPVYDLQTNSQSTLLLLKYALDKNCNRFVYAGTMSVYGEQPDFPVTETATTFPKSFYGVGKLASEHYLRIYRQYGIEGVSLRLFNVYGPGQNMQNLRQGMVSIYLAQAVQNHMIHVKGKPERFRDFVYIDDVVNAFLDATKYPIGDYPIFNIGTGVRTTVVELVEKIRQYIPYTIKVKYEGNTPGDMFGITANCEKANYELNWKAKTDLDAGLKQMIAWAIKVI